MNWQLFYEKMKRQNLPSLINNPAPWQVLLADRIRDAIVDNGALLEAGSGFGLSSLLVGSKAHRTLLDLEPSAIETARELFETAGQDATYIVGDLFDMPFPDDSFDIVFNAGVLEHFDESGRQAALKEMTRVMKPAGIALVAIPNHFSIPYRFSYEYKKKHGTWPYPDEEKLYDFSEELSNMPDVVQLSRETVDQETPFYFLTKLQRRYYKFLHSFKRYEGYLNIITLIKRPKI